MITLRCADKCNMPSQARQIRRETTRFVNALRRELSAFSAEAATSQCTPTAGQLVVGTERDANSATAAAAADGTNTGSWKGTLADDGFHWVGTGTACWRRSGGELLQEGVGGQDAKRQIRMTTQEMAILGDQDLRPNPFDVGRDERIGGLQAHPEKFSEGFRGEIPSNLIDDQSGNPERHGGASTRKSIEQVFTRMGPLRAEPEDESCSDVVELSWSCSSSPFTPSLPSSILHPRNRHQRLQRSQLLRPQLPPIY